jgi:hypothetical protein
MPAGGQRVQARRSSHIATDAEFGGQHTVNVSVADYVRRYMTTTTATAPGSAAATAAAGADADAQCSDEVSNGRL